MAATPDFRCGDRAERATGSVVSSDDFEALGIQPIPGRPFHSDEDAGRNAHAVVVISYQMWQPTLRIALVVACLVLLIACETS